MIGSLVVIGLVLTLVGGFAARIYGGGQGGRRA